MDLIVKKERVSTYNFVWKAHIYKKKIYFPLSSLTKKEVQRTNCRKAENKHKMTSKNFHFNLSTTKVNEGL